MEDFVFFVGEVGCVVDLGSDAVAGDDEVAPDGGVFGIVAVGGEEFMGGGVFLIVKID